MSVNKINILTEELIGKISAGEVVERPASAVKELVENSIDAGANSIEVEIQSAGEELIRVADNGEGMLEEDVSLACHQHATSKIKNIEDLNEIRTLGFRGEALSSIAAVSQMDIITCSGDDASSGVYAYIESGEVLKKRPTGRARGTTVEVRNLFFNVPARKKFLRKEATELAEIVNTLGRFILSHPDIEFKLTQDNRTLLYADKGMDLLSRIRLILGGDISEGMIDITQIKEGYKIGGYTSLPANTRKDRRAMMFFVNGRFVRSRVLTDAVYDAYRSMLERGRYPGSVLFLSVPPSAVDVNVHPTKLQVKFDDEKKIKRIVSETIKDSFSRIRRSGASAVSLDIERENTAVNKPLLMEAAEEQPEFIYDYEKEKSSSSGEGYAPKEEIRGAPYMPKDTGGSKKGDFFQIAGCYIIQTNPESITVIDQHAAHERILYEFFTKASEEAPVEVQNLLFPVRLDLSPDEAIIMEKIIDGFKPLGFHLEHFGDRSFTVQAVPAIVKDRDVKTVVHDILKDLAEYNLGKIDISDELVKLTACRTAIKSGDPLTEDEIESLLGQLKKCSLPFTCPHGRPTIIEITRDELEKRFRRK